MYSFVLILLYVGCSMFILHVCSLNPMLSLNGGIIFFIFVQVVEVYYNINTIMHSTVYMTLSLFSSTEMSSLCSVFQLLY